MRTKQSGFTLIEIAIVLVIIGLLLGGVLKGQELITSARVRNLISQQDGVKAAYFGFLDRFRALPGDYTAATTNIAGISTAVCTGNGDGDGRIETAGASTPNENVLAWEHLSKAGFINGSYTCAAAESNATTPTNAFAVFLQLVWDNVFDPAAGTPRHNLKTGGQIPSDLLAEVDRKIDDGNAIGGIFRFSAYDGGAGAPVGSGTCYLAAAPNAWNATTPSANCGGATLF
ncbi:MAG: prepilin-type N-terminal cleavage/methylation domain-containing protein [Betaproteobacteria bacterium]|nr:prepilin-type N-terminal cleavage/methylation domain-containing protein [Betaproteobacteria bacterium]